MELAGAVDRLEQQGSASVDAYASLIRQCGSAAAVSLGRRVHRVVCSNGSYGFHDVYIGNLLIQMYGKCGSVDDAVQTFHRMPRRNVFSWNSLITAFTHTGHLSDAVATFERMPQWNTVSWNVMVASYAQCGCVEEAEQLFNKMPERNVTSWNTMLMGYAECGQAHKALQLFRLMDLDGYRANKRTFLCAIDACASSSDARFCKILQDLLQEAELETDLEVATSLLRMHGKFGCIDDVIAAFEGIPQRDTVAWNALVTAYAQNGYLQEARESFARVPQKNVVSWNAMLAAYTQAGDMKLAKEFFAGMPARNAASWNTMVTGYNQAGNYTDAVLVVAAMDLEGYAPNKVTLICLADAFAEIGSSALVDEVEIWRQHLYDPRLGTALISMYGKCGDVQQAEFVFAELTSSQAGSRDLMLWSSMLAVFAQAGLLQQAEAVFRRMPAKGRVAWACMVAAYSRAGRTDEARELLAMMDLEGQELDQQELITIIDACRTESDPASPSLGRIAHSSLEQAGFQGDATLQTALLNMYGRCGRVQDAREVFNGFPEWGLDAVMFSSMIGWYARNGKSTEAFSLLWEMRLMGVLTSGYAAVNILTACSHAGLEELGRSYFGEIESPVLEHFASMVDLLARSGKVQEAWELLQEMPFEPDSAVRKSLLSACRLQNKPVIASKCLSATPGLDISSPYVLVSNTLSSV